jgi:hypothetical protein
MFKIMYYNTMMWVVKLFPMIIMMIFNMSTRYFHKIAKNNHIYAVPILLVGLPKKKKPNLDI